MMVENIYLANGDLFSVSGKGYTPEGNISKDGEDVEIDIDDSSENEDLINIILHGFFSSEAELEKDEDIYTINGDPTDGALTVLGHKININDDFLDDNSYEKFGTLAFDSDRKYMAAILKNPNGDNHLIIKGAPDVLLGLAKLDSDSKKEWENRNQELAENGMRVISLAHIDLSNDDLDKINDNIEKYIKDNPDKIQIEGLFGIVDPPREDAKESVKLTQKAGIKVKMITGDHPDTAKHIAGQIGINNSENVMTGKEIDELVDSDSFIEKIRETAVFARVSPTNKRQITDALREAGEIVAMTGDGVNDAPALSGSDIGIAMGIRGTEVAKESSHMILTDDRFGTIVDAIRVGRIIFENIKKYVSFLFACNMVEITAIFITILFGLPMPLQPLHILFLNLAIDVGPAISLAYETAEGDVMDKKPRDPNSGLVNREFLTRIIISGIVLGLASFGIFYLEYKILGYSLEYAQTATFAFMAIVQMMHILNVRKTKSFGLDKTLFKNRFMIIAVIVSVLLLLAAVYLPILNTVLRTEALDLIAWSYILGIGITATLLVFIIKKVTGFKG